MAQPVDTVARPTLLFVSNGFRAYGGGNCVVAWSLQALRRDWDITLFGPKVPDFAAINTHFGTDLRESDFKIRKLPALIRRLNQFDPDPFSVQNLAWLMRYTQKISGSYDAVMTCDDECDFGRPAIQYTHFPHMQRHMQEFRAVENLSSKQRFLGMLTGKLRPWLYISQIRLSRIRKNLMVTNSNWTADVLRDIYQVEPAVVYPPVLWKGPDLDWRDRRSGFVCLGRLSPNKRLLEIIDILQEVRTRGFALTLDIIGDEDAIAGKAYLQELRNRIANASDWVRLHQSISRAEVERVVSSCRFGIHGMHEEHFGIAPAELVRGGCVVFLHDSGGQVEIVGDHPELKYRSDGDAVEKICRVLASEELASSLRAGLAARAELFTENHFIDGIRSAVADFARRDQ